MDVFEELEAFDLFKHLQDGLPNDNTMVSLKSNPIPSQTLPNFEKGQPLVVRVVLPPSIGDLLIETKPETLAMPHFAACLIEAAITQGVYIGAQSQIMGEPAARQGSINSDTKKTNTKNHINKDLERHAELIREFWKLKKGSRGPTAWTLLMNELLKLLKRHGHGVVEQQLQLAINGKWASVSCTRYEQFKPGAKGDSPQEQVKHPAGRVFTAKGGFSDATAGGLVP